jgi:NAD(P)-dependent dehydrogenase (short-subunit alcohol dehydrogenase family)
MTQASERQVVLVTGSSAGFGKLFALTLARNDYIVFATMRDPAERNANNASELHEIAARESLPLHVLELDVTSDASLDRAVAAVLERCGRIDVAINNAGYGIIGLGEAVTVEQAQRLMDTNFFGAVRVNRAVLPSMRRQHSGLLLHISSGAGRLAIPAMGFYCASKFALEALAEAYRYELAGQGIDSVIVEPGAHQTSVFNNLVFAEDESRTETYGTVAQFPSRINAALSSTTDDPQRVADAVLQIVQTPPGERKPRYRVSRAALGVDEINAVTEQVQAKMLEAFGFAAETAFIHRKTAGTT